MHLSIWCTLIWIQELVRGLSFSCLPRCPPRSLGGSQVGFVSSCYCILEKAETRNLTRPRLEIAASSTSDNGSTKGGSAFGYAGTTTAQWRYSYQRGNAIAARCREIFTNPRLFVGGRREEMTHAFYASRNWWFFPSFSTQGGILHSVWEILHRWLSRSPKELDPQGMPVGDATSQKNLFIYL